MRLKLGWPIDETFLLRKYTPKPPKHIKDIEIEETPSPINRIPTNAVRITSVFLRVIPTAKFLDLNTNITQTVARIWAIPPPTANNKNWLSTSGTEISVENSKRIPHRIIKGAANINLE